MAITLDSIEGIPDDLMGDLSNFAPVFERYEYIEQLLEHKQLSEVAFALNRLCVEEGVVGIHYTRSIRKEIETGGLRPNVGDNRRNAFLNQYGHHFTLAQISRITRLWEQYFNSKQKEVRDNRLGFAFTLMALENGGAARLLTYFGGEQIYMPLTEDSEIALILKSLGEPMIVRCRLNPNNLKTFTEIPWGKIWLSTYHVSQNPDAYQFDVDAYQMESVQPDDITISNPNVDWCA